MPPEQLTQVLTKYEHELQQRGMVPKRHDPAVSPRSMYTKLCHAYWMCQEAKLHVQNGKVDKAFRWLGFIQGVLWTTSHKTLQVMKQDNTTVKDSVTVE